MYKELLDYKENQIKQRIQKLKSAGVLLSTECVKSVQEVKMIEDTEIGVKVYLLPDDPPMLPHNYVEMLKLQLQNDIFPLFKTPARAPFAVLRNTFSYLDHISALKFGKTNSMRNLPNLFRDFGPYPFIKKLYNYYYRDLVQLYRHDLVHSTQPLPKLRKVDTESEPQIVYWHLSSELRTEEEKILKNQIREQAFKELTIKLRSERNRKNLCHLRLIKNVTHVNVPCLFFDTVIYLEDYANSLSSNSGEIKEFIKNYIDNFLYSFFKLAKTSPLKTQGNKQIIYQKND